MGQSDSDFSEMKGLEEAIGMTVIDPIRDETRMGLS